MAKEYVILYSKSKERPLIGGPGTALPWFLESFLSWTVALTMLSVSGYHYIRTIYILPMINKVNKVLTSRLTQNHSTRDKDKDHHHHHDDHDDDHQLPCWLELTTASRAEQDNDIDRHEQLIRFLQITTDKTGHWTKEELVQIIRESDIARRLASLAMRPTTTSTTTTSKTRSTNNNTIKQDNIMDHPDQWIHFLQIATDKMAYWTKEALVHIIRQSGIARRLVSLVMRPTTTTTTTTISTTTNPATTTNTTAISAGVKTPLLPKSVLRDIWPELLRLPPPSRKEAFQYDISVIIPAFREHGAHIQSKLERALSSCQNPKRVEILIVDAGECIDLIKSLRPPKTTTTSSTASTTTKTTTTTSTTTATTATSTTNTTISRAMSRSSSSSLSTWGVIRVVRFSAGGGRGPCLNYGASQATGRLFVFVHSDTMLPPNWDAKIIIALDEPQQQHHHHHSPNNYDHNNNNNGFGGGVRANACTFSFGIDTSVSGLNGGPYPPGIKAVETTANWRTHLYSLPYGDQTLSVPAVIFRYLGGFPDQCLMEDYELISLLRRRAALLPKFGIRERERLVVIGGAPALCSPRRWQTFGVLYVTWMNSKFVNLYAGGMTTPDGLFTKYYGQAPPKRKSKQAPWEDVLEDLVVDACLREEQRS